MTLKQIYTIITAPSSLFMLTCYHRSTNNECTWFTDAHRQVKHIRISMMSETSALVGTAATYKHKSYIYT